MLSPFIVIDLEFEGLLLIFSLMGSLHGLFDLEREQAGEFIRYIEYPCAVNIFRRAVNGRISIDMAFLNDILTGGSCAGQLVYFKCAVAIYRHIYRFGQFTLCVDHGDPYRAGP